MNKDYAVTYQIEDGPEMETIVNAPGPESARLHIETRLSDVKVAVVKVEEIPE